VILPIINLPKQDKKYCSSLKQYILSPPTLNPDHPRNCHPGLPLTNQITLVVRFSVLCQLSSELGQLGLCPKTTGTRQLANHKNTLILSPWNRITLHLMFKNSHLTSPLKKTRIRNNILNISMLSLIQCNPYSVQPYSVQLNQLLVISTDSFSSASVNKAPARALRSAPVPSNEDSNLHSNSDRPADLCKLRL